MLSNFDPKMLDEILSTIHDSIFNIKSGIENYINNSSRVKELEDAYNHIHPLIDIVSMLELSNLCHLVVSIREMVEHIAAETTPIDSQKSNHLLDAIDLIEPYFQSLRDQDGQEEQIVFRAMQHYRRFKNLPESDDKRAILEILLCNYENSDSYPPNSANIACGNIDIPSISENNFDFQEEFLGELLEGFWVEAEEYLNTIGLLLPEISEHTQKNDQLQHIRRSVHTLKGAAGVVGLQTVAQLAHRMEDVLDDLYDGRLICSPQIKEVMLSTFDVLEDCIRDKKAQGEIESQAQYLYVIYDNITGTPSISSRQAEGNIISSHSDINTYNLNIGHSISNEQIQADIITSQNETIKGKIQPDLVRVPIEYLDELVKLVGELVITRSTFEQHLENMIHQVDELHLSIDRLQKTSTIIETQYEVSTLIGSDSGTVKSKKSGLNQADSEWTGISEFDELEFDRYSDFHLVSRDLSETSSDMGALGIEFRDIIREFDAFLTRQNRLTNEIQDKLMHFRMIPLSSLTTRLHRAVRVTARQKNKEVCLVIKGEEVQFDKTMLDELNEALLHILRNAVDHGIESPAERTRIAKPCQGTISLHAFREGTQIIVQIQDDGAGLNPQRIRAKAIENGLVSASEIESWLDNQLYTLIFAPGFSTAQEVSEVSGRGMGMDIVHEIVTGLKGRIHVESFIGQGTTLTIRLPVTLALIQVLLVRVNNQTLAIPLADVIQVLYIEQDRFEKISGTSVININSTVAPIIMLSEALNLPSHQLLNIDRVPVIMTQVGSHQVALVVDQLLGGREVVVKTLGMHLHRVHGLIGSTLMGDGSIVLILNPNELFHARNPSIRHQHLAIVSQSSRISEVFEILVVDDSFSVRRVVANLIKKAGWKPILAKHGLEALEMIQRAARLPDLILVDVEMPQMDGYELISTLRAQPAYQNLPIVMLTSRSGDKHRQKAFEVGATEYVVKPYRDESLLNLVSRLILQAKDGSVK